MTLNYKINDNKIILQTTGDVQDRGFYYFIDYLT